MMGGEGRLSFFSLLYLDFIMKYMSSEELVIV